MAGEVGKLRATFVFAKLSLRSFPFHVILWTNAGYDHDFACAGVQCEREVQRLTWIQVCPHPSDVRPQATIRGVALAVELIEDFRDIFEKPGIFLQYYSHTWSDHREDQVKFLIGILLFQVSGQFFIAARRLRRLYQTFLKLVN